MPPQVLGLTFLTFLQRVRKGQVLCGGVNANDAVVSAHSARYVASIAAGAIDPYCRIADGPIAA